MDEQEIEQKENEFCLALGHNILQRVKPFGVPCLLLLKFNSTEDIYIQAIALDGNSLTRVGNFAATTPIYIQ